jgi:hypothetical protein
MNIYNIILFVHVAGAIGYSAGTLVALLGLGYLRRAKRVGEVRSSLELQERTGLISGISLLLTILAGLFLAGNAWSFRTGWIDVALGSLVLLFLSGMLMGRRRHAILTLAKDLPDGPLPASLEARIHDPLMAMGIYLLAAVVLGILFLMTVKPTLVGSLIAIGVCVAVGLAVSLPNLMGSRQMGERLERT